MNIALLNSVVITAFAEQILITTNAGSKMTQGIFDSRYFEVQSSEGEVGMSELVTTLAIDLAETGSVAVGDTVVARETTYRVSDLRPDGQGMVVLDLEVVS